MWRGRIASVGRSAPVCLFLLGVGFFGLSGLSGCQSPEWNSVRQARADAQRERATKRLLDYRREMAEIEQETKEIRERVLRGQSELRRSRTEAREQTIQLERQLRLLQAAEEDLAATKARRAAAEKSIRDLEVLEARAAAVGPRQEELEKQVTAAEADLAVIEQQKTVRLEELKQLQEKAQASSAKVASLIEELKKELGLVEPPAAEKPKDPAAAQKK